jgi:hypothetical protein
MLLSVLEERVRVVAHLELFFSSRKKIRRHAMMKDVGKHPAPWENTALQGSLVASA